MLILNPQVKIENKMSYQCEFCKKTFARESTIVAHMCEPKRRRLAQNDRGVQLGFQAYLQFYRMVQGGSKAKSFDEFADSPYYRAFVKFGRYCTDTRVINPPRMIDWLLKNNKRIDYWCSDTVYTEYLLHYLQHEVVDDALARAIEFSVDWAEKTQAQPHDCMRYGNIHAICYAITAGRISPWAIYNSDSGQKFLASLHSQQVEMIWPYINSDVWSKRFTERPEDQAYAQEILTRAGW
jgi:hypothetical protein